jgi:superfamily II DNA or RNA helicase
VERGTGAAAIGAVTASADRPHPGDLVRIRAERWRVLGWLPYDDAAVVDVAGCDRTNRGTVARFLLPFEPIERLPLAPAPRVVRPAEWRRIACRALADATPTWRSLRAATRSRIDIVPFQLEPALAVTAGRACRLLIADEVGLGKTVQAGLIVAEVLAREPDAHALVVCPAGLRDQWRHELLDRFGLPAALLDAAGIARTSAAHAARVNPWSSQRLIVTSIDYIKRPEVMRALEPLIWDVVVFDEAHGLTGPSDRATAAGLLGARARRVVLLTATPHAGDEDAYRRLCRIGEVDDGAPLMVFRRRRADVGIPSKRKALTLNVRPSASEVAMHEALGTYAQQVWTAGTEPGARLAMTVLTRRACSSASSLARSVERRLSLLAGDTTPDRQLLLPLLESSDDDEPDAVLGIAGLPDRQEEHRTLEGLLALARDAARRESKVAALLRLLRRLDEPAIVFTEYRDTLIHLAGCVTQPAVQLHGGLSARERRAATAAFTAGDARLLLATDAASEGLNLHQRCRLVVNLELPWTPSRLEQRVGRVDRIGQQRRVHAIQLVARGTREALLTERLAERSERARTSLTGTAALQRDGAAEAARLRTARALLERSAGNPEPRPVVCTLRCRPWRRPALFWAWSALFASRGDSALWDGLIAASAAPATAGETASLARELSLARLDLLQQELAPFVELHERRERALMDGVRKHYARLAAGLAQRGLFDRRAERAASAQRALLDEAIACVETRLRTLDGWKEPRLDECRLIFALTLR